MLMLLEASAYAVVRGFFGDLHVVHVGLGHASAGDPHELRPVSYTHLTLPTNREV